MNTARNTAAEYVASKSDRTVTTATVEEMGLETVVKMGRAGINGALVDLLARLDDASDEDRADLLLEMLKAAR